MPSVQQATSSNRLFVDAGRFVGSWLGLLDTTTSAYCWIWRSKAVRLPECKMALPLYATVDPSSEYSETEDLETYAALCHGEPHS